MCTSGLIKFYPTFILLRFICLLQNPQVSSLHKHSFSKCSVRSFFFTCMPHSRCTHGILRNRQLFIWFCVETIKSLWLTTFTHCNHLLIYTIQWVTKVFRHLAGSVILSAEQNSVNRMLEPYKLVLYKNDFIAHGKLLATNKNVPSGPKGYF